MKVLNKRSNTPSLAPSPSELSYGELAINYKKGYEKLFFKNDENSVVEFITKDQTEDLTNTALNAALTDYTTTENLNTLLDGKVDKVNGKQLSTEDYTSAEKGKLYGIASGAQVNVIETIKVNGAAQTVTNKEVSITETDPTVPSWAKEASKPSYTKSEVGLGNVTNDAQVKRTEMGSANGVAQLGSDGKVPASQLPSYVDDVLEYESKTSFPGTGESGKIYVALDTNKTYRWSGSAYVEISPSIVIGTTTGTAYDGASGQALANKLASIAEGAEVNVQSDWNETNSTSDAFIKNKPQNLVQDAGYVHTDNNYTTAEKGKLSGIESGAQKNAAGTVVDASYVHTDNNFTTAEKNKLAGIESGAEANVQSNWTESDSTSDAFIKNKPQNLVQDANYVHTDNNYTTTEKTKLGGIENGAQANVLEGIKVNGTEQTITSKKVDISVPTALSQLSEDTSHRLVTDTEKTTWNDTYSKSDIDEKCTKMTEITYSALKSLRDNSQLITGMQYRITDYVTTTVQENTQSAGHQFDVIVVADDVNKLNENARACLHEGDAYFSEAGANLNAWEIKYSLDNDDKRFYWAVTGSTGRGVIYYMKDEWNNECPYDFKNIKFPRYEITACPKSPSLVGGYSINGIDGITVDTATTYWCYTFTWINEDNEIEDLSIVGQTLPNDESQYNGVFDNKIGSCSSYELYPDSPSSFTFALNNNCFISTYGYEDGIFYGCYANRLGNDCTNNTFGNNCNSNTFGNNCYDNQFGNDCYYNTFGNYFQYNTFGNSCGGNTFGNDCYYNTFGNSFYGNTFGNVFQYNTFGNYCRNNTFGNNCYRNQFGNYFQYNTFGNGCGSNTFGNDCYYNTFGNECQNIKVQKDYVYYIIVENGNKYINITSTQTTSSSNKLMNFTISQGVNNTTAYKTISHNTLNDAFKTTYQSANSQTIDV